MVINEKALVRQVKEAYKTGYTAGAETERIKHLEAVVWANK